MLYNILRSLVLMYFNVLYSFDSDLGVKYLIGCDATADVDDVLNISLSLTYIVTNQKFLTMYCTALALDRPHGGSVMIQQIRLAGTKRGEIPYSVLFPWKTWFPSLTKCGILFYITYI